jgi:hypothetical protein
MMKALKSLFPASLIILSLLVSSCASGPKYSQSKGSGALAGHNGKALVLIYWEPGMASAAVKPFVYVNQTTLPQHICRGGFISYEAKPGPITVAFSIEEGDSTPETQRQRLAQNVVNGALNGGLIMAAVNGLGAKQQDIHLRAKHSVQFNAQANSTYYLAVTKAGTKLEQVSQSTGEKQIQDCHWLNPGGS